jgi:hypothetical protein
VENTIEEVLRFMSLIQGKATGIRVDLEMPF